MVTPGIATSDKLLEQGSNNFLAAVHFSDKEDSLGASFLDISTGEFFVAEGNTEYIDKLLQGLKPAEVIFQRNFQKQFVEKFDQKFYTYTMESWIFDEAFATESLLKHFNTHSLKGFGIEALPHAITAAGAILHYLKETEHPNLQHITGVQRMEREDFLWMDRFTIRNLELLGAGVDQGNYLLKVIDNTVSPMGARLLRRWLIFPLKNTTAINERLDAVETLIKDQPLRTTLSAAIKACGDMERLVSKVPLKKINPREVVQLARGLEQIQIIQEAASKSNNKKITDAAALLDPIPSIVETIYQQIAENPPVAANKGGVIKDGFHAELDSLRNIATGGKDFLVNIQQREAAATGISSLKISFNNVFGYYLEVTNVHKNKVPDTWIRKQTLANAERYITPELKEYEEKIMGAEDKITAIEIALFDSLLSTLQNYIAVIQLNAQVIAQLDCLCCFADNALQLNYCKPSIHEGYDLHLTESRHPVIERNLPPGEPYISNDIAINNSTQQIIILTGPNMSGKSAILRQTALITLLAHMGSYVPATAAKIPLTDKIFTRVGASDNLSGGESTFMVEMNETASIVNNISARSLILLDEIGRGTSTYDGISIAWSIVEFLHGASAKPKTLFATHYHELNDLENVLTGVKNFHVTHKEVGNKIIFLRKLAAGGSTHSFGIHVATMAGMPPALISRANEILAVLESKSEHPKEIGTKQPKLQLSIFDEHTVTFESIRTALNSMDINQLTPVEALMKLNEIKALLK
jgi:DNA mismatch repair protein MutS